MLSNRPTVTSPREEMARLASAVSRRSPYEETTPEIPSLSQMIWESEGEQSANPQLCDHCGGAGGCHHNYGGLWLGDWPAVNRFALHFDRLVFRKTIDYPRHIGRGKPFTGTSWLNRPYHAGWFMGTMWGDRLISGQLDHNNDFFAGYRLGWDFDHYWGTETRLAFSELNVKDLPTGMRISGTDHVFLADVNLLYYPWGDSRWRPYLLAGLGFGNFHFPDVTGAHHNATLLAMPIGLGVKYQYRRWLAARLELLDNIAFANDGLETMHNVSLTLGVEVRWGVHPRSYWPWHPSRHIW